MVLTPGSTIDVVLWAGGNLGKHAEGMFEWD